MQWLATLTRIHNDTDLMHIVMAFCDNWELDDATGYLSNIDFFMSWILHDNCTSDWNTGFSEVDYQYMKKRQINLLSLRLIKLERTMTRITVPSYGRKGVSNQRQFDFFP